MIGKEAATGRKVAIKKIKLGQSQAGVNGIELSAIREVKSLQELQHPNIIEVRCFIFISIRLHASLTMFTFANLFLNCFIPALTVNRHIFTQDKPQPRVGVFRLRSRNDYQR